MPSKILAIDDSLTLRKFIANSLAKNASDYVVITAKDGAEGMSLALGEKPELILLDYILPDFKGDEVCRRLLEDASTANIPVVLMSSNSAEIKRAESEYRNICKSIAKPFTPELLSATVKYVLREHGIKNQENGAAASNTSQATSRGAQLAVASSSLERVIFSGSTAYFSLSAALRGIEDEVLTGILTLDIKPSPIVAYIRQGHVLLVTSRDAKLYLANTTFAFDDSQTGLLDAVMQLQGETGTPVFDLLAKRSMLEPELVPEICFEHSIRLFSRVWTAGQIAFSFTALTDLPEFVLADAGPPLTMDEWSIESLRFVGEEALTAHAWGDFTGIPVYTRRGYERIQHIPLNDDEIAFVSQVNGTNTLSEIVQLLNIPIEAGQQILFSMLCLEIFDYWPAAALRGQV
ncbi:MAG: PleD family two-component system response regulator [Candidatus Methylacidiphilales bacterium]|nr:response regulator [Candidatus Methylacidiphilales bacterium]